MTVGQNYLAQKMIGKLFDGISKTTAFLTNNFSNKKNFFCQKNVFHVQRGVIISFRQFFVLSGAALSTHYINILFRQPLINLNIKTNNSHGNSPWDY
jgi:hypothetical protein